MAETEGLRAEAISYSTAQQRIIHPLSLTLRPGEMTVIIGPNGAGKSTLMRLLTGYLIPDQGECTLNGISLKQWDRRYLARTRAVMRQHSRLFFPFQVREVIAMGSAPWQKKSPHDQILSVMQQTECTRLAERAYPELSGGEQQRVQLARTLLQLGWPNVSGRWLFLDEPTSALDLYHQQQTLRLLHRLSRQQHLGVCCILHDLNLTALYADRVLLLNQGQIVAAGTPQQVLTTNTLTRWYGADLAVTPHPTYGVPQVSLQR